MIIERKDAIKFGYDPAIHPQPRDSETGSETTPAEMVDLSFSIHNASRLGIETKENVNLTSPHKLSFLTVVTKLVKSPRALTVLFITLIYG
jgi:hypothetical protein